MTVLGWPAATYPKLNIKIIMVTRHTHYAEEYNNEN